MTTKELENTITNAKTPEWFANVELSITFHAIDIDKSFKGFTSIYEFFKQQAEGWNNIKDKIPSQLNSSVGYFNTFVDHLDNFINSYLEFDANQLQNQWNNRISGIQGHNSRNIFLYNCPQTEFLITLNNLHPDYVTGAHYFITTEDSININSRTNLIGAIFAYEFLLKDHTKITERRNAEKKSISKIRNDFEKYLSKSEVQLTSFLTNAHIKYKEYSKIIDELKESKESLFEEWFTNSKDEYKEFLNISNTNRENLEKTYREHLRLKEPAIYWKTRAQKLQTQGRRHMNLLISLVVFSAGLLFFLLGTISNGSLEVIFKDAGKAIKWSIVFVSFLSFLAYGVRLLAKASFSAFHLARDAEEREHLTYLYLSLLKDGSVKSEDRQLVLQSLFSRADTGLLKEDSSPSMPGSATGVVEKAIFDK